MLKLYGKYIARWTGADGKRHSKACKTQAAARTLQNRMVRERVQKQHQPKRRSKPSPKLGRNKPNGRSRSKSHATSSEHSGT
jgi:hypothetical protein